MNEQVQEVDSCEESRDELLEATRIELEHYEQIRELNKRFIQAHFQWEILKDKTSGAKKHVDELGKELSELIARGPDRQQKLEFSEDGAANNESSDWESVPVTEALALSAKQFDKLEEEGVKTMGQLEKFRADPGLHSIKGFGPAAITKIENQIIDWLTDYRDRFGEDVSMDEDVEGEDEDLEAEQDDESDTDDLLEEM